MTTPKKCRQCNQTLHGRFDKKFCDDHCRSNFNNHVNSDVTSTMRNINYILRKNRRILAEILPASGKSKIHKDILMDLGFDFRYFTHFFQYQKGKIYTLCYDYGYLELDSKEILLIQCKDQKRQHISLTPESSFNISNDQIVKQPEEISHDLLKAG